MGAACADDGFNVPYVCPDDSGRPGEVADGSEGSPCGFGPPECDEGLGCDFQGCTDDLATCGGVCTSLDDERAFCRQGRCTDGAECSDAQRCGDDGFCYPTDF